MVEGEELLLAGRSHTWPGTSSFRWPGRQGEWMVRSGSGVSRVKSKYREPGTEKQILQSKNRVLARHANHLKRQSVRECNSLV